MATTMKERLKQSVGKKKSTAVVKVGNPILLKASEQATTKNHPLIEKVNELQITSNEGFLVADGMLGQISVALKSWKEDIDPILKPQKEALAAAQALDRKVRQPLEGAEEIIKRKMKEWKLQELRLLQAAEDEKEKAAQLLRDQAAEQARRATSAATPQLRARLENRRKELERQAEEVEQQETQELTRGSESGARTKFKWRLTDIKVFATFISAHQGGSLAGLIEVNEKAMNEMFKNFPEQVMEFPGIEVYEDLDIVRRA